MKYFFLLIVSVLPLTSIWFNAETSQVFAQNSHLEEVLNSPSWQVVPGAKVGRNPADTLIDSNNILRKGSSITFDITGYQSFYYRLQGDCDSRQIRLLRRGLLGANNKVSYRTSDRGEATKIFEFHRTVLKYACNKTKF